MHRARRWHWLVALMVVASDATGQGASARQDPVAGARRVPSTTLEGQWVLPVRQAEAFAAAQSVVRAMGIGVAEERPAEGLIVTRRTRYRPSWPDRDVLDLRPGYVPTETEFHLFVAPGFEPARLVVGAVLWTEGTPTPLRPGRRTVRSTYYSQRRLGSFVAESVAAKLGVALVPLEADADARAGQAVKALPLGVSQGCGTRTAARVPDPKTLAAPPQLVHSVRPEYPRDQLERRVSGTVTLKAQLTEHGTLVDLERVGGADDPNLVAASFGAAGLWRLRAPVVDGCPVRTQLTIEMSFTISR